jgi:hypothetical protein
MAEATHMPIRVHHEFTFGNVPCLVMIISDAPPMAMVYVIVAKVSNCDRW